MRPHSAPSNKPFPQSFVANRSSLLAMNISCRPLACFSSTADVDLEGSEEDTASDEAVNLNGDATRGSARLEMLRDAESLLDAAIPTLRNAKLLVHYRSMDPALIAFSNHAFYNGTLS